jgi:hypothetical protein
LRGARFFLALACTWSIVPSALAWQSDETTNGQNTSTPTKPPSALDKELPSDPNAIIDLTFDDLKFDIEKGADFKESMLSDKLTQLEGRIIRLRGYMRPGFKQSGIKSFVLVRDNQECCFGPGAALYDCVMVKMAEDEAVDFSVRPISVVGKMQLKKYLGPDRKVWAIFRLNEVRQE